MQDVNTASTRMLFCASDVVDRSLAQIEPEQMRTQMTICVKDSIEIYAPPHPSPFVPLGIGSKTVSGALTCETFVWHSLPRDEETLQETDHVL